MCIPLLALIYEKEEKTTNVLGRAHPEEEHLGMAVAVQVQD